MKKFFLPILLAVFFFSSLFFLTKSTYSDELDDVTKQINDLRSSLDQSVKATQPLESELTKDQQLITNIKNQLVSITQDIAVKKKNIAANYQDLAEKEKVLNATIREFYIQSSYDSPILIFLSSDSASDVTRALAYRETVRDQNKMIITNIALSISDLETKKKQLEGEESRLVSAKTQLDAESTKLDTIVSSAKAYQSKLNNQIATLSEKQQQLIAAKQASLNLPTTAYTTSGGCSSDLTNGKDPGFSPKLAVFTFGVPHRVGMSQYGAKGRAEAGQSAETILSAYFDNVQVTNAGTDKTIHVSGTNEYGQSFDDSWNIEEYVKHIYEIPTNWPAEALKAQAIAARSYALATTNNGASSICPSQSCQVVKKELNSQAWIDAVNATAGKVVSQNGSPIKAWFSSTAGGYIHSSSDVGWSSTSYTKNAVDASGSVNSFDDLKNNAYDKASPWFYCDWGSRSQYAGTAWMKPSEMADIVNVILLAKADSGTTGHLNQTDKDVPDTWDADRVKQELKSRSVTPYTSVSSASVDWDKGSGKTTSVSISGDAGSQNFSGTDFKNFFNLRAPANINIVGPLYNIEVK